MRGGRLEDVGLGVAEGHGAGMVWFNGAVGSGRATAAKELKALGIGTETSS